MSAIVSSSCMGAKTQRPYLKDPKQFAYWKKSPCEIGRGSEVQNYASPLAHDLWYYLRSMGHVKHQPGWLHDGHHGEDGFVLHVMLRGELWHDVQNQRWIARRGDACLMDLGQEVTYGVNGDRDAELWWVWLNGKDMPRVFLELGADQDPVFALPDLRRTVTLLRELQKITIGEPASYEVEASGLLTMVLAQLFASRGDRVRSFSLGMAGRPFSEPVRKAIDYMVRHYDHGLSVKQLAYVARQSLTYFSRRFHQEVGMSPIVYVNRYRIERAKKFLAGSNQSVAQIARSVGFPNPHYFSRTFARIAGVSPLAYRKNPVAKRVGVR